MIKKYYGFHYWDGTNTTTGNYPNISIAGVLLSFESKQNRDTWVSIGYDYRVPRDMGEFRRAVRTKNLPHGWKIADAIDNSQ